MRYLFSVWLIIGLVSIIIFSGCTQKQDLTSGNEIEDKYNNAEDLMNSVETAEVKDNEMKHCVCHLMEIQYDYWIAKDEMARETTAQGKVKQIITRQENCAVQEGIPKQCFPLDFNFDELRNEWIKETEAMTCNCDIISYDEKYFD